MSQDRAVEVNTIGIWPVTNVGSSRTAPLKSTKTIGSVPRSTRRVYNYRCMAKWSGRKNLHGTLKFALR